MMSPKEQAAMQQALEALEDIFGKGKVDVGAITALREALDHSGEANEMVAMNLNCKSVQARLATSWGYVKAEQAEQEPVAWCYFCEDELWGFFTDPDECDPDCDNEMPLYAAPVRTKDLTDEEIRAIDWECNMDAVELARAVIAADREKNK